MADFRLLTASGRLAEAIEAFEKARGRKPVRATISRSFFDQLLMDSGFILRDAGEQLTFHGVELDIMDWSS